MSTQDQLKGYSIETQTQQVTNILRKYGCDEIDLFVEAESGALMSTPTIDDFLEKLGVRQYAYVAALDPDRMARTLARQLVLKDAIEKAGAKLVFVNFEWEQTPEGHLFLNLRGAISEYEREKTRYRTWINKRTKAKQGKMVQNRHLYGYHWDSERQNYIINEEQAQVVRRIFALCIKGYGCLTIARLLTAEGVRAPRGSLWFAQTVRAMLHNEAYAGVAWEFRVHKSKVAAHKFKKTRRPQEEWIPIPVPAIVDRATWEKAQRALNERLVSRRNGRPQSNSAGLLSGLARCGYCGCVLSVHSFVDKPKTYYCKGRKSTIPCRARSIQQQWLDDYVWDLVVQMAHDPELAKQYMQEVVSQSDARDLEEELRIVTLEIERLKRGRVNILGLVAEGLASKEEVAEKLESLNRRLLELDNKKLTLKAQLQSAGSMICLPDPSIIQTFTFDEKREVLQDVFQCIKIKRTDERRATKSRPPTVEVVFITRE